MPSILPLATTIGTPALWFGLCAAVLGLLVLDFVLTRKPHEVSMKEAIGWSAFYLALPLVFGAWIWWEYGGQIGLEFLTGYVVEKSLSIDNLFVFILLLGAFTVPRELQQRVLLYGIAGALVLRAVFIALGTAALTAFDWMFLVFGLILVATGIKVLRDAMKPGGHDVHVDQMRSVRIIRRFIPVSSDYEGPRMLTRVDGKRAITPLAMVVLVVFATDVVFAVDSVPAVYGITGDPFLVFATNAFALLGLRALYFVLEGALDKLAHLEYGLSIILGFIGLKLALHWAHLQWPSVPEVPTLLSLGVILAVLAVTTVTSLRATAKETTTADAA